MPAISASKWLTTAGWDDVPHLDGPTKAKMLAETPVHMRDARSKGLPSLGIGAVYRVKEEDFTVAPFQIPPHFARGYGFDVGWNMTAAPFMAWDRDQDILYITAVHYMGHQLPAVHAASINARAKGWMPGFVDPAARVSSQDDGKKLFGTYTNLGLKLNIAVNAVEAGIIEVDTRLTQGRLKVFSTCEEWFQEYRLYRRNKHGVIVKSADHLMDSTRYGAQPEALALFKTPPIPRIATAGRGNIYR